MPIARSSARCGAIDASASPTRALRRIVGRAGQAKGTKSARDSLQALTRTRAVAPWAAALLLALGVSSPPAALAVLQPGDVAPDFHKTDLDGNPRTLSQYRGKVVFLFLLGYS